VVRSARVFFFAICLCLLCSVPLFAGTGPVLVQGALEMEVSTLVKSLADPEEIVIDGWTFWRGRVADRDVVVSRTGTGSINAAAATLLAIREFLPACIINQGTAGGYAPDLDLWDIVLGERVVNAASVVVEYRDRGEGLDVTEWSISEEFHRTVFQSDGALLGVALSKGQDYDKGRVVKGTLFSCDRWSKEQDYLDHWHRTEGAMAEEMESAASAGIAAHYNVTFLAVRVISSNQTAGVAWDMQKAGEIAVAGQLFVLEIIKALP